MEVYAAVGGYTRTLKQQTWLSDLVDRRIPGWIVVLCFSENTTSCQQTSHFTALDFKVRLRIRVRYLQCQMGLICLQCENGLPLVIFYKMLLSMITITKKIDKLNIVTLNCYL